MVKIDFLELAKQAQKIAEDKKGENVIIIDVTGQTAIANYFVIITAVSAPQINAISNEIEKSFKYDFGVPPVRREGSSSSAQTWKVLDFGGILIHIMHPDVRMRYNLEKIWQAYDNQPAEKVKSEKMANRAPRKTKRYVKKTAKKTPFKKKTGKTTVFKKTAKRNKK